MSAYSFNHCFHDVSSVSAIFACRCDVVRRRAEFELDKAHKRLHLVQGFLAAMGSLERVVTIIREAASTTEADAALRSELNLSDVQAEGVLGLTLRRLTGLESSRLQKEAAGLIAR